MKESKKDQRKWIIIEDDHERAKYFIANILFNYNHEEIFWLYTGEENIGFPSFIKHIQQCQFCFEGVLKVGSPLKFKKIKGNIFSFLCSTNEKIQEYSNSINFENSIILLDVKHPDITFEQLLELLIPRLEKNFRNNKICINITTSQANPLTKREEFKHLIDRVRAENLGFTFEKLTDDCQKAVLNGNNYYKNLFEIDTFSLKDFLENMAKLDQHSCHNWYQEDHSKVINYKKKGRWDDEWDMPIQLSHLIKLLNYEAPNEFIDTFKLKNENGYFFDGHPIGECLKIMGTRQQYLQEKYELKNPTLDPRSIGSHSLSFMSAAFICWAAYINTFKNKQNRKDNLFINAIRNSFEDKEKCSYISRSSAITPPQEYDTIHQTAMALYDVMTDLYMSKEDDSFGKDNLKEVTLDRDGLEIRLQINPNDLFKNVKNHYKAQIFDKNLTYSGDTSGKLLYLFKLTNFCDFIQMDRNPFLGFDNGLKVLPAGEEETNGIIILLGHVTKST